VNLSSQRDRCAELEEECARLRAQSSRLDGKPPDGEPDAMHLASAHQIKIRELEKERAQLKNELQVSAICGYLTF